MKTNLSLLALFLILSSNIFAQNLTFSDQRLKTFLINEKCVDLDGDDYPDQDIDTNDDGEIQLSEVENIKNLKIGSYPDTFFIKSLADLDHFSALQELTVIYHDSLAQISNLGFDSLTFLWIANAPNLSHIDISNLNQLTDLRIEGLTNLDYLNLKNGNFPSGIFSLFYTENIKKACVDSIAGEYNEVIWHMMPGVLPDTVCENSTAIKELEVIDIQLFPNPVTDRLFIKTEVKIDQLTIFDTAGRAYLQKNNPSKIVNLSNLYPGIYLIKIAFGDQIYSRRIMKK